MVTQQDIVAKLDSLCKPPGSLGDLEEIATRLCHIQQTLTPVTRPRHVCIFAADHGVTAEGVSSWPSSVTGAVVEIMRGGRTASGVFARTLGCSYEVVDAGLLKPPADFTGGGADALVDANVARGSGNLLREAAMTQSEFEHAFQVGAARCQHAYDRGARFFIGGEMGIGNTTAASCLTGLLCNASAEHITGRGAGAGDAQLQRKQDVIQAAIQRVREMGELPPVETGRQVGGLEIVALAGYFCRSASLRCTILLDGFIATSAALLAAAIKSEVRDYLMPSHLSTEPGHIIALKHLGLHPVLDMHMRLGEATGALTALPLVDLAADMLRDMATLNELKLT